MEILYTTEARDGWHELNIEHYPAGEPLIRDTGVPNLVLLRPKSMAAFHTALFWLDSLWERGHLMPSLYLPCVPGARQDRLTGAGSDQLFTLKSVARELNARVLPEVVVLDPHSDVTPALIDRCRVVSAAHVIHAVERGKRDWDGIVAPDGGAVKRAAGVAQALGLPLYHGWKKRDVKDGKLTGFGCEPIPRTADHLLLVDDLCDGGGTFIGLAQHLFQQVAPKLSLYVTHGYFTQGIDKLRNVFCRIITTDSVLSPVHERPPVDGFEVIPVALDMLMLRFHLRTEDASR